MDNEKKFRIIWIIILIVLILALILSALFLSGCYRYAKIDYQEPYYIERSSIGYEWQAGAAKRVITPNREVFIAGYKFNRKSIGAHDDLYARCVVLSNGETDIGIISLDLIGMLGSDVLAVKNNILVIPPENIIVAFTHTHSGPDTTGLWGRWWTLTSGKDKEYMKRLNRQTIECIQEAFINKQKVNLYLASKEVKLTQFDGDVEKPDPNFTVLQAKFPDGKNLFTLMNYAFRPEFMNNHYLSADILASFYTSIEEKDGGMGIFLNGAQGNVEPNAPHSHEDWEAPNKFGKILASLALEALEKEPIKSPINDYTAIIRRKVISVKLENIFFKTASFLRMASELCDKDENIKLELVYYRIGNLEIATIPGEVFPNIAKDSRITANAYPPIKPLYTIICGLCNGAYGYIMFQPDYEKFNYHRSMFVGPIGEKIHQEILYLMRPEIKYQIEN